MQKIQRADCLSLILWLIMVCCLTLILAPVPEKSLAYITESSAAYAKIDADKKCDNYNTISCYNIGIKGGLIDGFQHKNTPIVAYFAAGACGVGMGGGGEQSPNYCAGYIQGYSKAYGRYPNASEYYRLVNNTAVNDASSQGAKAPSQVVCSIPTFCGIYLNTYAKIFPTNAPYHAGYSTGERYVDSMIKKCHLPDPIQIPGGSDVWKKGYSQGYDDTISNSLNDDYTFGNGCHY